MHGVQPIRFNVPSQPLNGALGEGLSAMGKERTHDYTLFQLKVFKLGLFL